MDYRPPCTSGPGMPGPYKAVQRQMGNRGKPPFFNYTTKNPHLHIIPKHAIMYVYLYK